MMNLSISDEIGVWDMTDANLYKKAWS